MIPPCPQAEAPSKGRGAGPALFKHIGERPETTLISTSRRTLLRCFAARVLRRSFCVARLNGPGTFQSVQKRGRFGVADAELWFCFLWHPSAPRGKTRSSIGDGFVDAQHILHQNHRHSSGVARRSQRETCAVALLEEIVNPVGRGRGLQDAEAKTRIHCFSARGCGP